MTNAITVAPARTQIQPGYRAGKVVMSEFNTRVFVHAHSQPTVREDGDRPGGIGRPATVTGTPAGAPSALPSPFELIPTGEAYGVCDLDGVCS